MTTAQQDISVADLKREIEKAKEVIKNEINRVLALAPVKEAAVKVTIEDHGGEVEVETVCFLVAVGSLTKF